MVFGSECEWDVIMVYTRLTNAVVLGRIVNYIEFTIRLLANLNGVDEQNLAAIVNPLRAAKLAAVNVQHHYIMGKELSNEKGHTGYGTSITTIK